MYQLWNNSSLLAKFVSSHLPHLSSLPTHFQYLIFFLIFYLFLDRGEGREKEMERNINVWLPLLCPTLGNLARNPGMCPDWG